jgi:predicted Zn-dependent peptidase
MKTTTAGVLAMISVTALAGAAIPAHPSQLKYPEISFTPPTPEQFRTVIEGVPVYLAPSKELPLISVSFTFRGGAYLEPAGKVGLAQGVGQLMRTGGTTSLSPQQFDEKADLLAANIGAGMGETTSFASLNCLTDVFDDGFALLLDMLRNPRFDQARFDVLKGQVIEGMKQRNDDGLQILLREWSALMYGEDHYAGRQPTIDDVNSITIDDMRALHAGVFHPGNMIIAVSGDFERDAMIERLRTVIKGWPKGPAVPPVPAPTATFQPGVYHIEKDQPQGQVLIGQRGITRDHPDALPVRMMNEILGGGGFTSRITNRVRTDEGLAYSAGSVFRSRVDFPGDFIAYYFSKNETVPLAGRTVFEELNKIRDFEVSTDELNTVKANLVQTFPRTFESKAGTLGVFVDDEWTNRPAGYWQTFRDKVAAVTPEDVQRVAREHLNPDDMVMLIVGPWDEISAGNSGAEADANRVVTMADIKGGGEPKRLPERDPLTLKPVTP